MSLAFDLSLAFVIIGALMLVIEISAPGNFLMVPATVLLALGAIGMIFPDFLLTVWSPLLAIIILVPMTFITIKLYQRLAPPAAPETTVATSLVGKEGVVEFEIAPGSLKGKVRIENVVWSATSVRTIPVGKRVKVVGSEGVHVKVDEI